MKREEVSLYIDVFTPETLPMVRLAEYLRSFSAMLGSDEHVHFRRVRGGSADCVAEIDIPAIQKVKDRLNSIAQGDAPRGALEARDRINELLAKDSAVGYVKVAGLNIIEFSGRRRAGQEVFDPVERQSSVEGQIFSIGGRDETINVHLRDGEQEIRCIVSIALARNLGPHLRGGRIRLFGQGSWARVDGKWMMKSFVAESFFLLSDIPLSDSLASIRKLFDGTDPDDFISTMLDCEASDIAGYDRIGGVIR